MYHNNGSLQQRLARDPMHDRVSMFALCTSFNQNTTHKRLEGLAPGIRGLSAPPHHS